MRHFIRGLSVNVVLLCLSSALTLFIAELVLHQVSLPVLGFKGSSNQYRVHPQLLYDWNPHLPDTVRVGDVTLRHHGPIDDPKRRFRVLILGDSYTQYYSWPEYLIQLIRTAGVADKIEIINAA